MEERFYYYFLTWLWTFQPTRLHTLVEYYGGPREFYEAADEDTDMITKSERNQIKKVKETEELYRFWEGGYKEPVKFISSIDHDYPNAFLQLPDYPYGIYMEGNELPIHKPVVAMVGARRCTEYGRELAYKLARNLAFHQISVVSGLAEGIDGASHRGCLDGGGYTLGILGAGIHTIYPRTNYDLFLQMRKRGGLLSEYPPDLKPFPQLFPRRNRLISILSDFLLVVEAREKSGSLITVDFALEQGKNIGAVPGRPCDPLSTGCNRLIMQGAKCITDTEDILEELMDTAELRALYKEGVVVNSDLGLAPKEKMVYSCLRLEPQFLDDILCQLELPVGESIQILTELEIKGFVKQSPHQFYYRVMG